VKARLLLALLVLALALVPVLSGPSSVSAQTAPDDGAAAAAPAAAPADPGTAQTDGQRKPSGGGGPSLLDLLRPIVEQLTGELFTRILVNLLQGVATALHKVVEAVMGSALNFVTQTPPGGSYGSPTVQALWGAMRAVANLGLVLVVAWGGFNLIAASQTGSPYHAAMELFPRVVCAGLLVNTSLWWAQLAIDANNALCQAIGQTSLPAWERADSASKALIDVIAALIYLVTSLFLLLQMLMRLALVDVLLVVSPLALLCWVLPQTNGWARLWSSTFVGTVFTQFVQVLALKLGGSLMTDLAPQSADAAVLALFLGVAVMVLTLKIPGLMRGQLGDGLGFARYYAYRQGARSLEGRGAAAAGKGG